MSANAAAHQLLLAEVGDTPDGLLAGLEEPLWAAEAAHPAAGQYAAVKVRAVSILITYYRDQMSRVLNEDERETLRLRLSTLESQRTQAVSEQSAGASAAGVGALVLPLVTTAPVTPRTGWADGNDPRYLGVPYLNGGPP